MGYYTYINGGLTIEPPINPEKFKDLIDPPGAGVNAESYFVHTRDEGGDEDVQIIDGQITVVGETAGHSVIDFAFDESVKAYDFHEKLAELVDYAKGLGYTVNGSFDGDGEESEDFWRSYVINNVVTTEQGEVSYPSEQYWAIRQRGQSKSAHGNVIPRPDGARVRCGGAPQCPECQAERDWLAKELYG